MSDSQKARAASGVPLFVPPGHFYSPITDPLETQRHLDRQDTRGIPDHLAGIALDRAAMIRLWNELVPLMESAPFPEEQAPSHRYCFVNPAYSFGDGSVLHAMIRRFRPRHLIEIGSGWSSACSVDTIEGWLHGECAATFIEPHPELLQRLMGRTTSAVRIIATPVQEVAPEIFDTLAADDILFIDSTHVLRTGSDVWFELFEVLPRLRAGVLVHIHDMFWPFEYPRAWSVTENRAWNEVYAVRAFLTDNPNWEILLFNNYLAMFEHHLIASTYSRFLRNSGGALWLRRR